MEYDYLASEFGFPEGVVRYTGLCRFDNLMNAEKPLKQILVMPTFRSWLTNESTEWDATEKETAHFRKSDFYQSYHALLTNPRLLSVLKEKDYRLVFYPHYSLQPYIRAFADCAGENVVIADRQHFDVQRLMMESAVMVTDFSSVFFDFAFMKKPEIFFQFDEAQFRKNHYKPGYFDYRRDAFGPVYTKVAEVVDALTALIASGCEMSVEYAQKVDRFFAFRDNRNCERTYQAIRELE